MPNKSSNRGRGKPDLNVRAYETMLIATGQMEKPKEPPEKSEKAVTLGRLGGLKGGKARADKLAPEYRKQIAKKAALTKAKKAKAKVAGSAGTAPAATAAPAAPVKGATTGS